ncbi:MAG: beta strand repeat-containing protein [Candidatus Sulfotelmatobacter sp.]
MKYIQTLFSVVALSMVAALVACSSGNTSTTPPPPVTAIAATSGSGQTASVSAGFGSPLVATVTQGGTALSGASVTFSAPSSGASGTFSNSTETETDATDANGVATSSTFTANATGGTYNVTATVSGAASPASFSLTNNAGPPIADGSYVFSVTGTDATGSPYFVAGQFVISGGAITGGEQDFSDFTFAQTDLINSTGNVLTTTADGNMQIQLATCNHTDCTTPDTSVGFGGTETFNGTLVSSTRARIVEFDAFATSSGTLDLQTSTAAPSAGYAFMVQGVNFNGGSLSIGGVLQMDGSGGITATGSVFDVENAGTPLANESINSTGSSVTGPDASGRVVITVSPTSSSLHPFSTAGYIVDATHIQLVEIIDPTGGTTGGIALGQNAANLAVGGNSYVIGMNGFDTFGPLPIAGVFIPTHGATTVTGTISYNQTSVQAVAAAISGGTYVADANGRVTMTGVTDGTLTVNIQLYVDGNGNALALTLDSAGDVNAGIGYQQTGGGSFTAGSFSGSYVMNTTGFDNSGFEFDAVGPITADGVGTLSSGFVDLNWLSDGTVAVPTVNLPVSGTFTAASSGVFSPGTITGLDVVVPTNADAFTYYLVDTTKAVAIEVDTNQWALGYLELQ